MAKIVKKHSISSAPALKMVDAAVAKAKEIGISENVAIPRLGCRPEAKPQRRGGGRKYSLRVH